MVHEQYEKVKREIVLLKISDIWVGMCLENRCNRLQAWASSPKKMDLKTHEGFKSDLNDEKDIVNQIYFWEMCKEY